MHHDYIILKLFFKLKYYFIIYKLKMFLYNKLLNTVNNKVNSFQLIFKFVWLYISLFFQQYKLIFIHKNTQLLLYFRMEGPLEIDYHIWGS